MDAKLDSFKNSSTQMCGYYSISSEREFDETQSSLRYFKKPEKFPIDLNIGIDDAIQKPTSYFQEKMDRILTYIVKNKTDFMCDTKKGGALIPSTKYITYRGVIKLIMRSPYEKRNGWTIMATKYKQNIYMCILTKQEDWDGLHSQSVKSKTLTYYGAKFEQHCLADSPFEKPDTSKQTDACSQFFGVFKKMLTGRNFLFAGELDGIVSDKPVKLNESKRYDMLKFIELKVAPDSFCSRFALENFKATKCHVTWIQSLLSGVQDVYFGRIDKYGIVGKIDRYPTNSLPNFCEDYWNPQTSLEFLDGFLKIIEVETAHTDCPNTVFEFSLNHITMNITCIQHPGKTELSLLPDWYLNAVDS